MHIWIIYWKYSTTLFVVGDKLNFLRNLWRQQNMKFAKNLNVLKCNLPRSVWGVCQCCVVVLQSVLYGVCCSVAWVYGSVVWVCGSVVGCVLQCCVGALQCSGVCVLQCCVGCVAVLCWCVAVLCVCVAVLCGCVVMLCGCVVVLFRVCCSVVWDIWWCSVGFKAVV